MQNKTVIFIVVSFIFCFVGSVKYSNAQNSPQPHFQNYSTEDGLPSPEVYCIFQDSKGYIWIGTDNGISRFDGYEFKNYSAKDGLTQNVVFEIQEDSKGRIWMSTMNGEVFIMESDQIIPFEHNDKILKYRKKYNHVKLKYIDEDDKLYFILTKYGFLILDQKGGVEISTLEEGIHTDVFSVFGDEILGCTIRANAVVGKDFLIKIIKKEKENIINISDGTPNNFYPFLSTGVYKNFGCVVNSKLNEYMLYNRRQLVFYKNEGIEWQVPFYHLLNDVIKTRKDNIIICNSDGNGIYHYDNVKNIKHEKYKQFLYGKSANCIFEDQSGGLWIGTNGDGIFYSRDIEGAVYDNQMNIYDENISALSFNHPNLIFAGTSEGNIYQINTEKGKIEKVLSSPLNKGQYNFKLTYVDSLNTLFSSNGYWKDSNFYRYERYISSDKLKNNKPTRLFLKDFLLSKNKPFYGISAKTIISNKNRSLDRLMLDIDEKFVDRISGEGYRLFCFYEDHQNRILVSREDGIFYYEDGSYTRFINDDFLNTRIEDINQLSDDTYILATKGKGIVLWKDTIQQVYTEDDGLASDMIEKIHIVNDTIWVATLNGLSRIVQGAKKEVRTFNMSTGLPSNEIYDIESNNGQVWLGTAKGLVKFKETPENKISQAPHLSKIQIGEQYFTSDSTAIVKYQENNIRIDYVTFNYSQQGNIPYRYRLQSDDRWTETKSTTALFTDLRSNDYVFEVQSQNEDGYWSESVTFPFCIKPAWYATWSFIFFTILFSGLIIAALVYRQFKIQAKRAAKELALKDQELAMQTQIRDLERSALQAQMNPHFIFNCLNSIQNFILENDQKNAVKYLAKFAHLTRQILNLSIDGKVNLEQEIQLLENYLSLEKLRFKNKFEYQIEIEPQINQEKIEIPPLLVQPFIENAIIHGMGSRTEGGQIEVNFTQTNDLLQISVFDNGLEGVSDLKQSQSKHNFKSVGMNITKKRLALLNEADEQDMIQFEEIQDNNKDKIGTRVSISIKV